MVFRAIRLYLFLLFYGLVASILVAIPEFFPVSFFSALADPTNGGFIARPFVASAIFATVISCLITSFFGVASWVWLKKIHPLMFVLSLAFCIVIVGGIFLQAYGADLLGLMLITYLSLYAQVLSIICWFAKQVYDMRGRTIAIHIIKDQDRTQQAWMAAIGILVFYAFIYVLCLVVPRIILAVAVGTLDSLDIVSLVSGPSLLVALLPGLLLAIYVTFYLKRHDAMPMVKFTRIAILVTVLLMLIAGCLALLAQPLPSVSYLGIFALSLLPTILTAICQVSVILSLSFWLTMKLLDVKNSRTTVKG